MSSTSSISSGQISANTAVAVGKNRLNALSVTGDGTNAGTVTVYDNATSATGKILAQGLTRPSDVQQHIIFTFPVVAENGLYVTVTGTNCKAIVYYGA